jgi:hypothetical protein
MALELPDQLSVAIVDSELGLVTEPRAMPCGDDGPCKPLPVALHRVPAGVMAVWVEYPARVIDGHSILGRVGTAYTRLVTIENDDRASPGPSRAAQSAERTLMVALIDAERDAAIPPRSSGRYSGPPDGFQSKKVDVKWDLATPVFLDQRDR